MSEFMAGVLIMTGVIGLAWTATASLFVFLIVVGVCGLLWALSHRGVS